jgi:hypothetical protein
MVGPAVDCAVSLTAGVGGRKITRVIGQTFLIRFPLI